MGLFDSVFEILKVAGRGLGGAIESVGSYFNSDRIKNFGKSVKNACSNVGKKVGNINATENHRIESVHKVTEINNILVEFSEDMNDRAKDIENTCIQYVEDYFDSILKLIDEQSTDIKEGINLTRLKRTRKKIHNAINGCIQYEIAEKISIDNMECMEILKIKSAEERSTRMEKYCAKVVKTSINKLDRKVQKILQKQNEEIADFLTEYEEQKEVNLKNLKKQLESLESDEILKEDDSSNKIMDPLKKILLTEAIMDVLQ